MKKTILITGASSGIGRAAAKHFALNGWNVVATMRKPGDAVDLHQTDDLLVTYLDVQEPDSIRQAIEAGIRDFGRIDALLNNAGFGLYGLFESTPRDKIQQQFDVNVFGVMDVTRAILPHFRRNKSGLIINVSSGGGIFTLPMLSLYCASKFALEGFSEALAYELSSQNIVVKIVEPHGGVSDTNFIARSSQEANSELPIPDYDSFVGQTNSIFAELRQARMFTAGEVAEVILLAATDTSSQLRYLVGDDARGFIKARREMTENDYVDFMRSKLLQQV